MIRATLISAAAFAGAMAAQAGEMPIFAEVDTNFDGVITQEEFVAYATADGEYTEDKALEKFEKISGDEDVITVEAWTEAALKYEEKKDEDRGDD